MKLKFKADYQVDIDLDLIGYTQEEWNKLSHYAKDVIIREWREVWKSEEIYDVEVCDG